MSEARVDEGRGGPTRCADCGALMPSIDPIDTSFTRYGWRVTRARTSAGKPGVAFFCPECWRARKPPTIAR